MHSRPIPPIVVKTSREKEPIRCIFITLLLFRSFRTLLGVFVFARPARIKTLSALPYVLAYSSITR